MHNFCRDFHIELLPMHTPKRFSENNDGVLIVVKFDTTEHPSEIGFLGGKHNEKSFQSVK
ncbi:MAG: hypothetical protein ACOVSW_18470 [Candidatus Kapaibacteriota bacterium]